MFCRLIETARERLAAEMDEFCGAKRIGAVGASFCMQTKQFARRLIMAKWRVSGAAPDILREAKELCAGADC